MKTANIPSISADCVYPEQIIHGREGREARVSAGCRDVLACLLADRGPSKVWTMESSGGAMSVSPEHRDWPNLQR